MAKISPERRAALDREKAMNSGGGSFIRMKDTPSICIRIPPLGPGEVVGRKCVKYFLNNKTFLDNVGTHGRPGVLDRAYRELGRLAREGDKAAATVEAEMKKNHNVKYIMKVLDRADGKVKWFEAPQTVYKPIFTLFDVECEAIDDLKEGIDIKISRSGVNRDTEYTVRFLNPSPLAPTKEERTAIRAEAAAMDVNDLLQPDEQGAFEALADVIPAGIWKKIKRTVGEGLGLDDDADSDADSADEEDDDDAPVVSSKKAKAAPVDEEDEDDAPPSSAKKATKAAPVAADDDEEDEAPAVHAKKAKAAPAPVEDDEEEEEAPAPPKKNKPAPAPVEDDEDAGEETADEEEEEAPVVTSKKVKPAPAPVDEEEDDEAPVASTKKNKPAPVEDDEDVPQVAPKKRYKV